jgi:hypothetical protein
MSVSNVMSESSFPILSTRYVRRLFAVYGLVGFGTVAIGIAASVVYRLVGFGTTSSGLTDWDAYAYSAAAVGASFAIVSVGLTIRYLDETANREERALKAFQAMFASSQARSEERARKAFQAMVASYQDELWHQHSTLETLEARTREQMDAELRRLHEEIDNVKSLARTIKESRPVAAAR